MTDRLKDHLGKQTSVAESLEDTSVAGPFGDLVRRDQSVDVSPLERVELAYEAGRHAARILRKEALPEPCRLELAQSLSC